MDHKKFMLELQKRTGLDKSRLNLLLKTTEDVLRQQAINMNTVELTGLGCFEPRKRLEFIHEEPATGKTTLYPPRIVVHFTPDASLHEKISTQELKQLITKAASAEPAFVNVFIDDMIHLIIETVERGEEVHIDGWGTFRRVTVGGGHYTRIVFFADDKMKEGVNAPFAQFEPVVLKEGVTTEPKEVTLVNTSNAETAVSADVVIKEDTEMKQNPEPAPDNRREAAEEAEEKKYREEMEATEAPVEVSDGNGNLTQRVDRVMENVVSDETGQPCNSVDCAAARPFSAKHGAVVAIVILLAVCIIGAGIYFVVRIDQSKKMPPQVEQPASPTSQVLDSVQILPDDSTSTSPVVDTVQVLPAPTTSAEAIQPAESEAPKYPIHIVLKPGQRLTLLALRYYGNKFFWVYIYEANKKKYPDPEAVPAGAKLIIPDPADYGIDANNAASVEKAKQKAARILSY